MPKPCPQLREDVIFGRLVKFSFVSLIHFVDLESTPASSPLSYFSTLATENPREAPKNIAVIGRQHNLAAGSLALH
jgi:hypothetical protein